MQGKYLDFTVLFNTNWHILFLLFQPVPCSCHTVYNKVHKKITNYAEISWGNDNKGFPMYQTTVKQHIKAFKLQRN